MTRKTRKIGLGVMGFADMLIELGIPYDSEEAVRVAEEVMSLINTEAHKASEELGELRGVFPAYKGSVYDKPNGPKMRNASLTTIAPTGTLSIIAGCSSGIEPLFGLLYVRYIMNGRSLLEVNEKYVVTAKQDGFYSLELMKQLAAGQLLSHIEGVPEHAKRLFITALDVKPEWHVAMQAAFQRHVDNAVSKTVNLPHEATFGDVEGIYTMASEQGLKGITIYRDRSRPNQPLSSVKAGALLARYLSTVKEKS
jgi:ribonucleoside-diphosphate reductase alpha chain